MNSNAKLHWFERFRPDGRPEPHVTRGDNGEIAVFDSGWMAFFKNGQWHDFQNRQRHHNISLYHEQLAEFRPVQDRDEIYRIFNEARVALGLAPEDPS